MVKTSSINKKENTSKDNLMVLSIEDIPTGLESTTLLISKLIVQAMLKNKPLLHPKLTQVSRFQN